MTSALDDVFHSRTPRADARRNRERLLEAALESFAEEGLSVPVEKIARRAGVGIGTVYRHFPTKDALFEAIVVDRIEHLAQEAQSASTSDDPGKAFFEFVAHLVAEVTAKKDLFDSLAGAGIDVHEVAGSAKEDLERSVEALLQRAQAAGAVREDVLAAEVLALLTSTCLVTGSHEADVSLSGRLLTIVCDGLRSGRAFQ